MTRLISLGLAAALTVLAGCDLYFNDGDDVCAYGDTKPDFAGPELRDPFTGLCQSFGGGGGCGGCGPCAQEDNVGALPQPDWGSCFSECEALDESSCVGAAGCRAAYNLNSRIDAPPSFLGCWAVAPSGPIHGACENLDAQECSRHDDCSAYYDDFNIDSPGPILQFTTCKAESSQGCYGDQDCGAGAHCTTSDGECLTPPGCGEGMGCPAVCYGRCVMDNDTCTNVDCGSGSHCEEQCYPCDSTDPGTTCDPICQPQCVPDQTCDSMTCPTGYECVTKCDGQNPNDPGCGVCTISCQPSGTCEGLATEAACAARGDCTTVYQGEDCTCYPNGGCVCQVLTYERCESLKI